MRTRARSRGLSLLEVIVALSILAIIMLLVATMSGRSQANIMEATLQARAEAAARFTMEQLVTSDFNGYLCVLGGPYDRFQQANPNTGPKVSSEFAVNAPGCPTLNNFGSITVREPTAAECNFYRYQTAPAAGYRGWRGWDLTTTGAGASGIPVRTANGSSTAGPPGTPNTIAGQVTCLLIIVEIRIPKTPATSACNVRLQSLRFFL